MNKLRYNLNFDYSKPPVIRLNNKLSLDPSYTVNNSIDELRISQHVKNPPLPRQIPEVDEIERERMMKYGERVDIQPETLIERFRNMVLKVPARRKDGTVIHDPPFPEGDRSNKKSSLRPAVMRYMTFVEMLNDPYSLLYRVNELINRVPSQQENLESEMKLMGLTLSDIMQELELIRIHLLEKALNNETPLEPGKKISEEEALRASMMLHMDKGKSKRLKFRLIDGRQIRVDQNDLEDGNRSAYIYDGAYYFFNDYPATQFVQAFREFSRDRYLGQIFELQQAIRDFRDSGGVPAWFRRAIDLPLQIKDEIPSIGAPDLEEKKEDSIEVAFQINGIPLPKMGGLLNDVWYDNNIKSVRGRQIKLSKIIKEEMMNDDMNRASGSFYKPFSTTGREFYKTSTIIDFIRDGKKSIIYHAPNSFELVD